MDLTSNRLLHLLPNIGIDNPGLDFMVRCLLPSPVNWEAFVPGDHYARHPSPVARRP